ncbi:hypothetical protein ENSA5_36600 [Enhygromyxa salina]|uniref:Uncharacterized protein n=1 Tax=Enhygromyxa salina TaxID=215803 RepID=A0A2S9XUS2_9BACT|nr:hypothetical protein [Enhygromyxa salina]PRP96584.1 hypothetical protein ENSA5_36600 [Enhygromyxa salina]
MFHATVFAAVLSSFSPLEQPPPLAVADEYIAQDGRRVRWASVTYTLPDGQTAEVVLVADDTASGEGYLFVDGEAIAHSSYDDANGVASWRSSAPGTDALAGAALVGLSGGAADELLNVFTEGPQEFPCSKWGKKVLRAGKYIWGAMVAASAGACCGGTGMAGCGLCSAGGAVLHEAGREALEGYCD